MRLVRTGWPILAGLLSVVGLAAGCTPEPDNNYEPVSDACLACLSEHETNGCKAQFDACEGVDACDDYVVCQLMGRCFTQKPNSGCEEALACYEPSDKAPANDAGTGKSPRDLARAVEKCARSTCARVCDFVED